MLSPLLANVLGRPAHSEPDQDNPAAGRSRSRASTRSEPRPGPSKSRATSQEPSLAESRPRRNAKPPGEWWKVRPAPARAPLEEESEEEEEFEDVPLPGEPAPDPHSEDEVLGELAEDEQNELALRILATHDDAWATSWSAAIKCSDTDQ